MTTDQTGYCAKLLNLDTSAYEKTTGTPNLTGRADGLYSYGLRVAQPRPASGTYLVLAKRHAVRDTDGKPSHTTKQHIGYVERALSNAGYEQSGHTVTDDDRTWNVWY